MNFVFACFSRFSNMVINAGPEAVTVTQQVGPAQRSQGLEACEGQWRLLGHISIGQDCLPGA